MATVAVVAGAAATTAAAAYSASQAGGGKGGGASGPIGPSLTERLFNRGTEAMLAEERAVLESALAEGALIQPELYRALGLQPVYDREENPELAALAQRTDAKNAELNALQSRLNALRGTGPGNAKARAALKKDRRRLQHELSNLQNQLGASQAVPRRIVGFEPIPGVADPTGSAGGAFGHALDLQNAQLEAALKGELPVDPTLASAFDERERTLREQLRRQMGPDFESSTAGQQALQNFAREKAEAFAQYNRETIKDFAAMTESRAGALADLTSARLRNLMAPSVFRASQAESLGRATSGRLALGQLRQQERFGTTEAAQKKDQIDAATGGNNSELLATLLSGVGSGANSYASYLNNQPAQPTTVTVPSYPAAGISK